MEPRPMAIALCDRCASKGATVEYTDEEMVNMIPPAKNSSLSDETDQV